VGVSILLSLYIAYYYSMIAVNLGGCKKSLPGLVNNNIKAMLVVVAAAQNNLIS
jgi:hypothetical protein